MLNLEIANVVKLSNDDLHIKYHSECIIYLKVKIICLKLF